MPTAGNETILIVDDESAVLTMAQAMLTRYGYAVIAASSGKEALTVLKHRRDVKIHLALIDVVMQDMAGTELAKELRYLRPDIPVLFMTGFPDQHQLLTAQRFAVLRKPFTSVSLVRRIRDILDRPRAAAAAE